MADAVAESPALKVYICNLMWEPGETEGYSASDHLRALLEHSRGDLVDCVVVNDRAATAKQLRRYRAQHSFPVEIDRDALEDAGARVIALDLLAKDEVVRHNSDRIAELLADLARQNRVQRRTPAVLG